MAPIVVILIGEPEQIRAGRGETALTTAQACMRLGMSDSRLRQLIDTDGKIAPIARIGKTRLFRESDVERLRAERERAISGTSG